MLIGVVTCLFVLYWYSAVIATNPGNIYKEVPAYSVSNENEHEGVNLIVTTNASHDVESGGTLVTEESKRNSNDSTTNLVTDHPSLSTTEPNNTDVLSSAGFKEAGGDTVRISNSNLSASETTAPTTTTVTTSNHRTVPATVECGQCQIQRPYSARHCYYCKVCVEDLDHHCPWCGKCIGEDNMNEFKCFVGWLNFQFYFLFGCFVYFIIFYRV